MIYRTHLAFGLLVGLFALPFSSINKFLFLGLVLLGSLLPDIDHENSKINNKLKFTKIIGHLFKHRGIFHTLLLAVLLPGLVWYFVGYGYGVALFAGYMSHLVIDGFTLAGINFLHPFANLRLMGFIETGTVAETLLFVVILAFDIIKINLVFF